MAGESDERRNPFAGWQTFGLPAFASALAPWYNKLVQASLIPEWYESSLSIVASVLGPLVCFLLWFTCNRFTRRGLVRLAYLSLAVFLSALLGCLALMLTVDIVWFPEQAAQVVLRLAWPVAYLAVFAAFSAAIVSGLLLARRPEPARARKAAAKPSTRSRRS